MCKGLLAFSQGNRKFTSKTKLNMIKTNLVCERLCVLKSRQIFISSGDRFTMYSQQAKGSFVNFGSTQYLYTPNSCITSH